MQSITGLRGMCRYCCGCCLRAGDVITELGEQLEAAGMMNVFAIPKARMPVVKFEHPHTGETYHTRWCVACDHLCSTICMSLAVLI